MSQSTRFDQNTLVMNASSAARKQGAGVAPAIHADNHQHGEDHNKHHGPGVDKSHKSDKPNTSAKQVGLIGLVGVVISAMVGGGIYSLPQNMSASASAGGQIIAWIITGVGMWFIANTFRILTRERPELKNGLYTYAYKGFGKFVGFLVAYGYWICNCFSLVAYGVLIMSTLNFFFPGTFAGGNTVWAVLGASIIIWLMFLLTLRGTKSNVALNVIGTICKIVPVLIFIVAMITMFELGTFLHGFWGVSASGQPLHFNLSNVMDQVSGTMMVTLWLFIGVEGAVVISGSAKSQKDVSKATTFGYLAVLFMYVLVSLLPLGVYNYQTIGGMSNPSMAVIMDKAVGSWGGIVVNAGVIISVLSAWLVWLVMLSQMPLFASYDGIFPKIFRKTNSRGAAYYSLLVSACICQVLLIICHFVPGDAWSHMISITSVMSMPCYLLCCLFLWKIARGQWKATSQFSRTYALVTGIIGTFFSLFLIYSAGLHYLMLACIIYAIGIPIFMVGRKQCEQPGLKDRRIFTPKERVLLVLVICAGIVGLVYTASGLLH